MKGELCILVIALGIYISGVVVAVVLIIDAFYGSFDNGACEIL